MKNITKEQYEHLEKQHEEGCKNNDYSKMIMSGDENDLAMKRYIRDNNLCKHHSVNEYQGGQVEICSDCGKQWGN